MNETDSDPSHAVLVVGAGPVGHALAAGLSRAGVSLRHWSRSAGALWAEGGPRAPAEIVVLAVRDEVIGQAAQYVVDHGAAGPGSVLLHCAGALPPEEAFAAQRSLVRGVGLLHPLRAFTLTDEAADLSGTVMAVCGDMAGLQAARRLGEALGGVILELSADQLPAYHAAAALCAGHVAAVLDAAATVLAAIGLPRRQAEQALAALCLSAAENIYTVGLPQALSGPAARGDVATVRRHLLALPAASPEAASVYRALLPAVVRLARDKGSATPESLAALDALCAEAPAATEGTAGGSLGLNLPPKLS